MKTTKQITNYISLKECKHGGLYKIRARNFEYGVFIEEKQGFIGIRLKFQDRFLFTEYHWDIGAPYGTVKPLEFIEMCPLDDIREGWSEDRIEKGFKYKVHIENKALFIWLEGKRNNAS